MTSRPEIAQVGTFTRTGASLFRIAGWWFDDDNAPINFVHDTNQAPEPIVRGWTLRELHDSAHGAGCTCCAGLLA